MLSLPHLIVIFVVALMIFGPQKLPELARMLGKATAEFRKMTSDFRFALEDEVRELERQTRIRDEEVAAALQAAKPAQTPPEGTVQRILPPAELPVQAEADRPANADSNPERSAPEEHVTSPHEKSSDDNVAV
jgi:sec-independent protein translocase protein TatB